MADQDKPFVVNDKRKFRSDGELREPSAPRPDIHETTAAAPPAAELESSAKVINFSERAPAVRDHDAAHVEDHRNAGPIPINSAHMITPVPEPDENAMEEPELDDTLPAPPTAEEFAQVQTAYSATAERLDTVMRAANPGGEHLPAMDFTRMVQSVYMTAMMQLGAGTPQGEQARVDLLGAKQSIDMLGVIADKSEKSLDSQEKKLIESALFELRMGFLEMTQMLARQAQSKQGGSGASPFGSGGPSTGGPGAGPRVVR